MKLSRFVLLLSLLSVLAGRVLAAETYVYLGTNRNGPGLGISVAKLNTDTGALSPPTLSVEAIAPTYLALHPDGKHLYAANSGNIGGLSAFAVDAPTGKLTYLNRALANGGETCFITLDQTNRFALVANYNGGNVAAFALRPDGGIGDWTAFVQHTGSSVHPRRQTKPYAHSIILDPSNQFALAADLGTDQVRIYRFDAQTGTLKANTPAFGKLAPGSGPRHSRFHPNGRWVYVINEINSTMTGFNWDGATGTMTEFQTLSTLPADFTGNSTCAEVRVHPNGKFLYGSNRGHDSIVVYAIDPTSGQLTLVQHESTRGRTPRNFAFDPSGKWILALNQDGNNVSVFRVDDASGKLTPVGEPVAAPAPFGIAFLPVK